MSLITNLKGTQGYFPAASRVYRYAIIYSNDLFNKPIAIRCQKASVSTKSLIDRYKKSRIVSDTIPDLVEAQQLQKLKHAPGVNSTFTIPNVLNTIDTSEDPRLTKIEFSWNLSRFQGNKNIPLIIASLGVNLATYKQHLEHFCREVILGKVKGSTYQDSVKIYHSRGKFGLEQLFIRSYLAYLLPLISNHEKVRLESFHKLADLKNPAAAFPKARRMQRKIIMHVGPTKSEKIIQALKRLQASNKGIYCGPIRLMAYEVWKRFTDEGLPCDLVTEEEHISATDYFDNPLKFSSLDSVFKKRSSWKSKRRASPLLEAQQLVSATTEMLCVDTLYDVAVIDEIQLLGDQQRGWAWTRALLGVQAHEVHLCGDASAVPIIQNICRELNEEVVINQYPMLSSLKPNSLSLRSFYASIKRGDCFVTSSRSDIFKHKDAIERVTGIRCAVIYDQLPAETRAQQARLFNDPISPYKVLIATDVIGMGLNLNIQRIIFESLEDSSGKMTPIMPVPQVKQIAGRAGQFNNAFSEGEAVCFSYGTSGYLVSALKKPVSYLTQIGIQPEVECLKLFAYHFPKDSIARLLIKYAALAALDSRYFLCFGQEHVRISSLLSSLPLTIEDRLIFMMSPINLRNSEVAQFAFKLAQAHAHDRIVEISKLVTVPPISFTFVGPEYLEAFETAHECVRLYHWLSFRFPFTLNDVETAKSLKSTIEKRIEFILPRVRLPNRKSPQPEEVNR